MFVRIGHKLRMSQAGDEITKLAIRIHGDIRDTTFKLRNDRDGLSNYHLRLGAEVPVAVHVIPQLARLLKQRYPELSCTITTGTSAQIAEAVNRGVIDLGLVSVPVSADLQTHRVVQDEILIVVNRMMPPFREMGPFLAQSTMANQPLILPPPGTNLRKAIDFFYASIRVEQHVSVETEDANMAKALVRSGLGLAFLPNSSLVGEVQRRELSTFRVRGHSIILEWHWVFPKFEQVPRVFATVMDTFGELPIPVAFQPNPTGGDRQRKKRSR